MLGSGPASRGEGTTHSQGRIGQPFRSSPMLSPNLFAVRLCGPLRNATLPPPQARVVASAQNAQSVRSWFHLCHRFIHLGVFLPGAWRAEGRSSLPRLLPRGECGTGVIELRARPLTGGRERCPRQSQTGPSICITVGRWLGRAARRRIPVLLPEALLVLRRAAQTLALGGPAWRCRSRTYPCLFGRQDAPHGQQHFHLRLFQPRSRLSYLVDLVSTCASSGGSASIWNRRVASCFSRSARRSICGFCEPG